MQLSVHYTSRTVYTRAKAKLRGVANDRMSRDNSPRLSVCLDEPGALQADIATICSAKSCAHRIGPFHYRDNHAIKSKTHVLRRRGEKSRSQDRKNGMLRRRWGVGKLAASRKRAENPKSLFGSLPRARLDTRRVERATTSRTAADLFSSNAKRPQVFLLTVGPERAREVSIKRRRDVFNRDNCR